MAISLKNAEYCCILTKAKELLSMNAIIYTRQSSGDETLSESVELQKEKCREVAKKEKLTIIGEFEDLNTSGKTYPEGAESIANMDIAFQSWYKEQTGHKMFRRGFGNALKALSDIDYILCYDITRLYRPISGSFLESYVNQLLIVNNVKIMTVNNGILDVGTFNDSLITALQNRINHEHIATCRRKSMAAFRKLRDSGYNCNGGKAFGLMYKGKWELDVDPEKAKVVKFIFREIANYRPYNAIIRYVNAHWSHCFKKCCYESNLYHIAANPIYAGYMYNTQKELIKNIPMNGKEIISFDEWKTVQDIMAKKRRNPPKAKFRWLPFSGMLFDGYTGSKLVVSKNREQIIYFPNITNLKSDIKTGGVVLFQANKKDYSGIYEAINPILLLAFRHKVEEYCKQEQNAKKVEEYKLEIENMNAKEQPLFDMFSRGVISEDQLERMLINHKKRKAELQKLIAEGSSYKPVNRDKMMFDQWTSFCALVNNELPNETYEKYLKEVIRKIVVFEDRIIIHTVYGEFTLKRYMRGNKRHFPKYEIDIDEIDTPNYSKFDFRDTRITIKYLYPSAYKGDTRVKEIALFDRLRIVAIGKNEEGG